MYNQTQNKTIVAAFDFDGTLSYHDTLFYFLLYTHGVWLSLYHFVPLLPTFAAYLLGKLDRQQTKEAVLSRFFSDVPIDAVKEKGIAFSKTKLHKHIKPEAKARLEWHQRQGHRCILISASLDAYLAPWAKEMGFRDCITSRLESVNGLVTGKLIGKNCRGVEKVRRLDELLGPRERYYLFAYGDSDGDRELLAFADAPFYRRFNQNEQYP